MFSKLISKTVSLCQSIRNETAQAQISANTLLIKNVQFNFFVNYRTKTHCEKRGNGVDSVSGCPYTKLNIIFQNS